LASITHRLLIINPRPPPHIPRNVTQRLFPPNALAKRRYSLPQMWQEARWRLRPKAQGKPEDRSAQTLRNAGRRRDIRILETSCMGLCPKGGVTALNATHRRTIHVISVGSEPTNALRTLLGDDVIMDRDGVETA
jgi:hypothetical protein